MSSVTNRIKEIKQPRGGYINPNDFTVVEINDGNALFEEENVHGSIIGMVVDYMTRFLLNGEKEKAFSVSLNGAAIAVEMGNKKALKIAKELLNNIKGLDKNSIINACKLVTFDVWYRNTSAAMMATGWDETNPDVSTINNIIILINRSLEFFRKYGPITVDGFTFEPENGSLKDYEKMINTGKGSYGGYTATVETGDGDFLTEDTLWDFKVSKSKPTNKHTLQLLMYWIMGQHSGRKEFKKIKKLGIFNPRLNVVYLYEINKVSKDIISEIERDVICY